MPILSFNSIIPYTLTGTPNDKIFTNFNSIIPKN